MLWFRAPEKVYIKAGCLTVALSELGDIMHKQKAFIVTDSFLYQNGYTRSIEKKLDEMGIVHTTFSDVAPDPTLGVQCVHSLIQCAQCVLIQCVCSLLVCVLTHPVCSYSMC